MLRGFGAFFGSSCLYTASTAAERTDEDSSIFSDPVFNDVPISHVYYEAIQFLAMTEPGHSEHTYLPTEREQFRPREPITRGELARIYERSLDVNPPQAKVDTVSFEDVTATEHGTETQKAIHTLVAADIMSGISEDEFRPSDPVTNQKALHLLTFFDLLYEKPHGRLSREEALEAFRDADQISEWARPRVGKAVARGYVNPGFPENEPDNDLLEPRANCERGQFAVYLYRKLAFSMPGDEQVDAMPGFFEVIDHVFEQW
jgi:hypothetical protein